MYNKKKFYRNIESVLKKFFIFFKNSKNLNLHKAVQSAIYNTSENEKILFVNKNNTRFLLHSKDIVSKKIFIDYEFDYKIIKKALSLLGKKHKRKTLINIGANIGSICIKSVKEKYFNSAIVFEPEEMNFKLLMSNVLINNLENKIIAHKLALSNTKTTLKLSLNKKSNLGDNRIINKLNNQKKLKIQKVKSDKLDNFISNHNKKNTLIFMDVQGHEPYVFMGAKKSLKKKIPIVFEFSPLLLDKNWDRNFYLLYKNYKYFYDLHDGNKKKLLNRGNILSLFNKLKLEKNYTDLLII